MEVELFNPYLKIPKEAIPLMTYTPPHYYVFYVAFRLASLSEPYFPTLHDAILHDGTLSF